MYKAIKHYVSFIILLHLGIPLPINFVFIIYLLLTKSLKYHIISNTYNLIANINEIVGIITTTAVLICKKKLRQKSSYRARYKFFLAFPHVSFEVMILWSVFFPHLSTQL